MATIHVAVEATSNTEAKWGGRGYHPAPTSQVLSRRDRLRVWRRRGAPSFSRRSATTLVPSSAARTRPRFIGHGCALCSSGCQRQCDRKHGPIDRRVPHRRVGKSCRRPGLGHRRRRFRYRCAPVRQPPSHMRRHRWCVLQSRRVLHIQPRFECGCLLEGMTPRGAVPLWRPMRGEAGSTVVWGAVGVVRRQSADEVGRRSCGVRHALVYLFDTRSRVDTMRRRAGSCRSYR